MDPFIALSFLALPVIPEIRITDLAFVRYSDRPICQQKRQAAVVALAYFCVRR